jgi:anti-anti-sigma regulatory factor
MFIIIDCSSFNYVDVNGLGALCEIAGEMKEINVEVKYFLFENILI